MQQTLAADSVCTWWLAVALFADAFDSSDDSSVMTSANRRASSIAVSLADLDVVNACDL